MPCFMMTKSESGFKSAKGGFLGEFSPSLALSLVEVQKHSLLTNPKALHALGQRVAGLMNQQTTRAPLFNGKQLPHL